MDWLVRIEHTQMQAVDYRKASAQVDQGVVATELEC